MVAGAVIFDMDGLLINSEPLQYEATAQALKECEGIDFPITRWPEFVGIRSVDVWTRLIADYGLDTKIEVLRSRKDEILVPMLRQRAEPMPGVIELIDALRAEGIALAIASSSRQSYIEMVIERLHLVNQIPTWVSGEHVECGKPAPDIYLLAAQRLYVEPAHCLALEDSEPGVLSAKAAGMKAIAVPTEWTASHNFDNADIVFPGLVGRAPDVINLLNSLK